MFLVWKTQIVKKCVKNIPRRKILEELECTFSFLKVAAKLSTKNFSQQPNELKSSLFFRKAFCSA
jgi:hypothetical protein